RQDGPTRTRPVAAAISSSAGSAGWYQRSLNVVTTSKPPSSATRASAAYSPGRLSVWRPSPSSRRRALTSRPSPPLPPPEPAEREPLDAHDHALVGIRAGDERVLLEPVAFRERPLLGGEQRQDGLEREDAEVLAVGDPQPARLGQLEVVADLEPADGPALD